MPKLKKVNSDEILVTNCHEIIQAAQIAKDIGCDYFELKPVVNENHHLIKFSKKAKTLIQSQLEELQKLNSKSFRIIYPKSLEHALNSLSSNQPKIYTNCPTSELRVLVTPSGIYPCPYKRGYKKALISNLDVKFDEFWLSDKRKFCSKQINPNTDCQFYCIRHELNLFLNVLSKSYAEGIDLLPYIITTEALMDDFFI